jgi:hypothetical protein
MNFGMIDVLIGNHTSDIRRQAGPRRTSTRGGSWPARAAPGGARLRDRIGFALVEAGLHLLATNGGRRAGAPSTR